MAQAIESLGLQDLAVEDGALVQVPVAKASGYDSPVYESHKRGKNWLAVISIAPAAPGGLNRVFQTAAKGEYYYMVDGLHVGDPIEFGADYYTGAGGKRARRYYGVIRSITEDCVVVEEYKTGRQACKSLLWTDGSGAKVTAVRFDSDSRMSIVERESAPPVGIPSESLADGLETFRGYTGG